MFPQIDFSSLGSARGSASMSGGDLEALQKALNAGYGTEQTALTGGSALRIQSLDKTMYATIQENEHFRFINAVTKNTATATTDEWTEKSRTGGRLGGSTSTEDGAVRQATGSYARRVGQVKYLFTRRQVSVILQHGNNLADAEAEEAQNGALQLLQDAEFLCFEGDSAVVPTEFDGIYAQMVAGVLAGAVDPGSIIDARASSLNSVEKINTASAQIARRPNFGRPTHIFTSLNVQADFDTGLDPAFRVPLTSVPGGGIDIGAPVIGIRTSHGNIATMPDVFIRDSEDQVPYQIIDSGDATANTSLKPQTVTPVASSDSASLFASGQDGLYYYAVEGLNAAGVSDLRISAQVTVAAGDKVTLTIAASAGAQETGYAIYRGRKNGTNAPTDFRLVTRVARTNTSTVFVDLNRDIPGTVKAYVMNMAPAAISWQQYLPMMKYPLSPVDAPVIPWLQLLAGYLRMTKRRQHVVIKNILYSKADWKPFG